MKILEFILLYVFFWSGNLSKVFAATLDIRISNCKSCSLRKSDLPREELRQLRFGYIKEQILRKLQLSEPPKTNLPKPPLKPLLVIAEMAENETKLDPERMLKTESVVIYPKEGNTSCIGTETYPCSRFEFGLTDSLILDNFLSAEIWVYRRDFEKALRVQQIIKDSLGNYDEAFDIQIEDGEENKAPWVKVVLPTYSFWSRFTINRVLTLQISNYISTNSTESVVAETGDEKPFLIIRGVDGGGTSRTRRSTNCIEDSSSCCRENFYLNFSEIGWENWILHPEGYQANFCRGRCFNDLSSTRFYHSAVLLSYIRDNKDIAEEIGLNMCCTPSIMSPVSIIYRNEEGLIYHKSIENMKVEACDCA